MGSEYGAVLIVGASGAIGSAVALRLASSYSKMGLHYITNVSTIQSLKTKLEDSSVNCEVFQESLDSEESCNRLVEDFCSRFGNPGGLVLCSGTVGWRNWQELQISDWDSMFHQHCVMPFFLVRQLLPYFEKREGGRIVFLSSISPKYGGSSQSLHYAAAKAALETAMLGMAKKVASLGIIINGVRAGYVETPQQLKHRTDQEIAERIVKIPVQRAGKSEDVAGAFEFLMSPAADYVTGSLITVAGGD